MLRTMLASFSILLLCTAATFAGDCGCGVRHGRPMVFNAGAAESCGDSCGTSCGSACSDPCSDPCASCSCRGRGCGKCCFPLLRGAVKAVGTVVNLMIPRPCCRSKSNSCGSSCGDLACSDGGCGDTWDPTNCSGCQGGAEYSPSTMPSHSPSRPSNPFIDDQPMPTPAPAPSKEARVRTWKAPVAAKAPAYSAPAPRTVVQKTLKPQPAVRVTTKPVNLTQPATRNVMKITHDEQIEARLDDELQARLHDEEVDSAPVAPSSVRLVGHEENRIPAQQPAELPATTVATPIKARPTNPLR